MRDDITRQGCTIDHEYSLIKGFRFTTLHLLDTLHMLTLPNSFTKPEVSTFAVKALSSNPAVENVEADQTVTTQ